MDQSTSNQYKKTRTSFRKGTQYNNQNGGYRILSETVSLSEIAEQCGDIVQIKVLTMKEEKKKPGEKATHYILFEETDPKWFKRNREDSQPAFTPRQNNGQSAQQPSAANMPYHENDMIV